MKHFLLFIVAAVALSAGAQEVICHRGYWDVEGSAQNSIRSLVKADSIGAWGSEFDVWMTADGVLVVNHDEAYGGVVIETAKWKQLKNMRLKNILELKPHTDKQHEAEAARRAVKMVRKLKLTDRVEYITFSYQAVKVLKTLVNPCIPIYYLNGDMSPRQLSELHIAGIDYSIGTMRKNPEWIDEAHSLGMKVNVWTVNSERDMDWCINYGVDFITTNDPLLLQRKLKR